MAAPVLVAWVGSARWPGRSWIGRRRRVRPARLGCNFLSRAAPTGAWPGSASAWAACRAADPWPWLLHAFPGAESDQVGFDYVDKRLASSDARPGGGFGQPSPGLSGLRDARGGHWLVKVLLSCRMSALRVMPVIVRLCRCGDDLMAGRNPGCLRQKPWSPLRRRGSAHNCLIGESLVAALADPSSTYESPLMRGLSHAPSPC
jgi:hypothetical protein